MKQGAFLCFTLFACLGLFSPASNAQTATISGASVSCASKNGVLCVDSTNSAGWSGSDPGAWIQAAYNSALCAPAGCTIDARGLSVTTPPTISTGFVGVQGKPISLMLPFGTIKCSAAVCFQLPSGSAVQGQGTGDSPEFSNRAGTMLQAAANNTVLIENVASGPSPIHISTIHLDGNKASFTGTQALALNSNGESSIENVIISNFSAASAVTVTASIVLRLQHLVVSSNSGIGIHVLDSGAGNGNAFLDVEHVWVVGNGGDGFLYEGTGSSLIFNAFYAQNNSGSGLRIRQQASSALAPSSISVTNATFEDNCDASYQMVVDGGTAGIGPLSLNTVLFTFATETCAASPTAILVNNVNGVEIVNPIVSSGATNAFNFTGSNNLVVINPISNATNFYKAGSILAGTLSGGNPSGTNLGLTWSSDGNMACGGAGLFGPGSPPTFNCPNGWELAAGGSNLLTLSNSPSRNLSTFGLTTFTFSNVVNGLNGNSLVGPGLPGILYNTASTSTNANIAATTMFTNVASTQVYRFTGYIDQTASGTSCTGSTTVTLNVIFTDPNASTSTTVSIGTFNVATSGNGAVGNPISSFHYTLAAKASTAVQYSTSAFTAGTGCSTSPAYRIYPRLEAL